MATRIFSLKEVVQSARQVKPNKKTNGESLNYRNPNRCSSSKRLARFARSPGRPTSATTPCGCSNTSSPSAVNGRIAPTPYRRFAAAGIERFSVVFLVFHKWQYLYDVAGSLRSRLTFESFLRRCDADFVLDRMLLLLLVLLWRWLPILTRFMWWAVRPCWTTANPPPFVMQLKLEFEGEEEGGEGDDEVEASVKISGSPDFIEIWS